jgi:hypothetical protein
MRKLMLFTGVAVTLALGAFGCSHTIDTERANYHESRAESAARHGDYAKAAEHQRKEEIDRSKAETAPLP